MFYDKCNFVDYLYNPFRVCPIHVKDKTMKWDYPNHNLTWNYDPRSLFYMELWSALFGDFYQNQRGFQVTLTSGLEMNRDEVVYLYCAL